MFMAMLLFAVGLLPNKAAAITPSCVGSGSEIIHVKDANEFKVALNKATGNGVYIVIDNYFVVNGGVDIVYGTKGVITVDLNGHGIRFEGNYGICINSTEGVDLYFINSGLKRTTEGFVVNTIPYLEFEKTNTNQQLVTGFTPSLIILNSEKSSVNFYAQAEFFGADVQTRVTPNRGFKINSGEPIVSLYEGNTEYGSGKSVTFCGCDVSVNNTGKPVIYWPHSYSPDFKIYINGNAKLSGGNIVKTNDTAKDALNNIELG